MYTNRLVKEKEGVSQRNILHEQAMKSSGENETDILTTQAHVSLSEGNRQPTLFSF